MDNKWRTCRCPSCGGHGVVSVYSAYDFEGPGECGECGGSGSLFIRPSGHLFQWPGGPACGMGSREEYEAGTPWLPQCDEVPKYAEGAVSWIT